MRLYTPEEIEPIINKFAYASSQLDVPISRTVTASGYVMPLLGRKGGFDPSELLMDVVRMQAMGIYQKSGTWIERFGEKITQDPNQMPEQKAADYIAKMQDAGLMDKAGNPLFYENGIPSMAKAGELVAAKEAGMTFSQKQTAERFLAGEQGGRFMAMLADPKVLQLLAMSNAAAGQFPSWQAVYDNAAKNDPVIKAEKVWADTQRALMDLGATVLPSFMQAIKDFDTGIKTSENQIKSAGALFTGLGASAVSLTGVMNFLAGGGFVKWLLGEKDIPGMPPGRQTAQQIGMAGAGLPFTVTGPASPDEAISAAGAIARRLRDQQGGLAAASAMPVPPLPPIAAAPQVNVNNQFSPTVTTHVTLDSAEIAAHVVSQAVSSVTSHVLNALGSALHLGNMTNSGPAGGSLDAPAGSGIGPN